MPTLRIAVLGAGDVGATLGRKWLAAGHSVIFGVREVSSDKISRLRAELGELLQVRSMAEAIAGSDVVVLAVTGSAVAEVVSGNAGLLNGKIVIDAANQRVKGQAEETGQWGERKTLNSLDVLQKHAPNAAVFRAFNSYSWEIFADPAFGDERADLFYAGPAGAGQATVEQLISDIGVHPVRVGGLEQVETVDNVLALWASLALFAGKGRDKIAFKVLER